MNGEGLISWNIPNFITIVLMIAIIWTVIGTAGHILIRRPAARATGQTNTTAAPGGIPVAVA